MERQRCGGMTVARSRRARDGEEPDRKERKRGELVKYEERELERD